MRDDTMPSARRCDTLRMTSEELLILNCIVRIERMPHADPRLTDAQEYLRRAQMSLADWIDGVPRRNEP